MSLIVALVRRAPVIFLTACLVAILSGVAGVGLLILLVIAVANQSATAAGLAWAVLALGLLTSGTNLLALYLVELIGQGEVFKIRRDVIRQILGAPLRLLEKVGPPRLLSVLTEDTHSISAVLIIVPMAISSLATIAVCLAYFAWLSLPLFGILLGFLIVGCLSYQLSLVAGMRRYSRMRQVEDELFEHYRGFTEGAKELMLNCDRRRGFFDLFNATAETTRRLRIVANMVAGAIAVWGQFLFFIALAGLVILGPRLESVDRDHLWQFMMVLFFMVAPLHYSLEAIRQFGRAQVAMRRIQDLGVSLREDAPALQETEGRLPQETWQELRLDGLTYTYESDNGDAGNDGFRVGPFDLTFRQGELVFVVGGNGSGKTSLAKLLLGFYRPDSGSIRLDGEALTEENMEDYRKFFSAVFADFFLFESLLGTNKEGLEEKVGHYLEKLDLAEKVRLVDGAWSTTALSYGQRKRMALLVAYLEDRQIYVFDEWAAGQDPTFKRVFYEVLLPELKKRGKTVIVITHDDHYYRAADRIIKMEDGRIELDGSTQEYFEHQQGES